MTVALRGHHLLCTLTFVGRGYDERFVATLETVIVRLTQGEAVEIVAGPDAICAPRLGTADAHCDLERIQDRDTRALAAIGTLLGRTLSVGDRLILDRAWLDQLRPAFAAGTVRAACLGCQWADLCTGIAGSDFTDARLAASSPSLSGRGDPAA